MNAADFEDALFDLIDKALSHGVERDEIIASLELKIMAMNEETDGDD